MKNKILIKLIIILIPLTGFIVFILYGLNSRNKQLEKEPGFTYGIIARTYVGAKARDYVEYEFQLRGQVYSGHQNYLAHIEYIQIGDTCEVIYALSNPEISRLLKNKNETLKIRNQ